MKVSVIIPCYNVGDYIEACIGSVMAQFHPDLEIICINDGSSDDTLEKLQRLKANFLDDLIIIDQANQGAPVARNAGLEVATGEYIQFLDADDIIHAEKISHQVDLITQSGFPDILAADYKDETVEGESIREVRCDPDRDLWLSLALTNLGITSSNLWKKSAVEAVGNWAIDLASSQETDLMFRMLQNDAAIAFDPEIMTTIRKRKKGNISSTNREKVLVRYIQMRERMIGHLKAASPDKDLHPILEVIMNMLRELYQHNPDLAIQLHDHLIPKRFSPSDKVSRSFLWKAAYKIFGFKAAQRLASLKS